MIFSTVNLFEDDVRLPIHHRNGEIMHEEMLIKSNAAMFSLLIYGLL